ncbi:ABC transporter permease [Nocardia aurea]|uniref:ABC transporter permease n=1 Tax=Nocardia aurea TaxID=2144174 RepID=A0ABV3FLM7_9NOCA
MNTTQRAFAVGLAAALLQALMLIAFAWPAANIEPRDLPIAVTGPQAQQVAERLDAQLPDAFEITTPADEAAARAAIVDREVYGAVLTGGGAPRVLVASGASPAVAQQLTAMAQQLSGVPSAAVEDVVAADADDPRGTAFGAMVLPLVMSGIAAGVLLSLLVPTPAARIAGLATFGVVGGLLGMVIIQGWMSVVPGSYLALAAVAGLVSFAVAGAVVGLASVIGRPGIGIAALTMLLIGNPFSAATSAPELLPQPWGAIGQYLPPGAASTLLRSVAFFDGAGAAKPLTVLLVWAVAAVVLIGVAVLRGRRVEADPVPVDSPEPVPAV